jgi:CRISPR-associated protein Cas2
MLLISYDITNTKNRSTLSKYLLQHGRRLQKSVFEIDNHYTIEQEVIEYIKLNFRKKLKNNDSILILNLTDVVAKQIIRYGKPIQKQKNFIII